MDPQISSDKKRLTTGILIGVGLFILSAGVYAVAILMVSVMVFGCTKSPPEWVYLIVLIGFPIPLIFSSIIVPYLFIKRQRVIWIVLVSVAGIIFSIVIFFVWFLILTQYC